MGMAIIRAPTILRRGHPLTGTSQPNPTIAFNHVMQFTPRYGIYAPIANVVVSYHVVLHVTSSRRLAPAG